MNVIVLIEHEPADIYEPVKHVNTATGFESQRQRWQPKLPKDKRFFERSIRNLVGSQDELEIASRRLCIRPLQQQRSSTAVTSRM